MDDGFYHGINKLKKPATKVSAPPGGASHFNIFSAPEPEPQKDVNKCQAARTKSSIFKGPTDMNPSRDEKAASKPSAQASSSDHSGQHTSTKVLAPPGGQSHVTVIGSGAEKASGGDNEIKRQEKHHTPGPASHNIFGGGEEVIGQRAKNRKPPGGESHNIFG